jgi:hypothetical protein
MAYRVVNTVGKYRRNLWLKVHLHNIIFLLVWPQNSFRLLLNHLKFFFILVADWPRYSTCCTLYIFSVYIQICSVYSQYTLNLILRFLSIHTVSFCCFHKHAQQKSVQRLNLILPMRQKCTDSFLVFSACI